jgi:hypothetical protein
VHFYSTSWRFKRSNRRSATRWAGRCRARLGIRPPLAPPETTPPEVGSTPRVAELSAPPRGVLALAVRARGAVFHGPSTASPAGRSYQGHGTVPRRLNRLLASRRRCRATPCPLKPLSGAGVPSCCFFSSPALKRRRCRCGRLATRRGATSLPKFPAPQGNSEPPLAPPQLAAHPKPQPGVHVAGFTSRSGWRHWPLVLPLNRPPLGPSNPQTEPQGALDHPLALPGRNPAAHHRNFAGLPPAAPPRTRLQGTRSF